MKSDMIKTEIDVKGSKIGIMRVGDVDYISLTDLAKRIDSEDPRYPIQNWLRNKDIISYLGLWEEIHNKNFNRVEFDTFKNEAGSNTYKIS